MKKLIILCLLVFLLSVFSFSWAQQKTVWLDDVYRASFCVQDWGMPQKNQAVVWTPSPLRVNGVVYERGVVYIPLVVCCSL